MTHGAARWNQGFTYRAKLGPEADGLTVIEYLTRYYRHSSEGEWNCRVASGRVWVEGQPVDGGRRLRRGETLLWKRPPWREPDAPACFAILYRDEHLLAVAKPRGLPTLPGGGFLTTTLVALVRKVVPEARPVHRLDRSTSGVSLFARTKPAYTALTRAWQASQVTRVYRALVSGSPDEDTFTVDAPVGAVPHRLLGKVHAAAQDGKPARSEVRVLERRGSAALVEVSVETGRTHQVRIHLAAAGFPALGDPLYPRGGVPAPTTAALPGDPGFWLHARRLAFLHPASLEWTEIECLPPPVLRVGGGRPGG